MPEIDSEYLGLSLKSPLVVSSCPLTGELDGLRRLEDGGAAACILPSLFEEQIVFESSEIDHLLETGAESFGEALSYFPDLEHYNTGPDHYLELIADARSALEIPVIASLNGSTPAGWLEHARLIEQAGAHAIELNLHLVAADPETTSAEIEGNLLELVAQVRSSVRLPVAVKIGPFFSSLAHLARELVAAGADGLVLFNRFYDPDLDLDSLEVTPRLTFSTSEELRLALRWIGILYGHVDASLAATSGVKNAEDVLKALLAGADVAMLASVLLERGPRVLHQIERDLIEWLDVREYESVAQLRGSVSRRNVADPAAFERGNYMRTLSSYSSSFRS